MALAGLVSVLSLTQPGCATVDRSPAWVMSQHAQDFQSGEPGPKNLWDQVVASVNSRDYAKALSVLEQMRSGGELTPGQKVAVNQTEAAVKKQMAATNQPR